MARKNAGSAVSDPPATFHLTFPGTQTALRDGLDEAMAYLRGLGLGQEKLATAEIVLAEVLNNVIEHAYEGGEIDHGQVVEIEVSREGAGFRVVILDDGRPMPGDSLPEGKAQDLDCARENLPEGGFGWFLIRELSEDLVYSRTDGRNRLSFALLKDTAQGLA